MRRITVGLAALGVAVALALAGCGGGGDGTNAVSIKALKAAAAATAQAESMSFTVDQRVEFGGLQLSIHADGVGSADGKQAQLTATSSLTGDVEARLVDGVVYVKVGDGALGNLFHSDKPWIRFDAGDSASGGGSPLGSLFDPMQGGTPKTGLELLKGVSGDVETVGDDTVAGRHAVHYRASIDYSKVGNLPGLDDDARAKLGSVPVDVWIDDQDRVVKVQTTIDPSMIGVPDVGASVSMTMEVTEFGVPVDVQPPPADQVFDISDHGDGRTI